jgi:hypothetical protein
MKSLEETFEKFANKDTVSLFLSANANWLWLMSFYDRHNCLLLGPLAGDFSIMTEDMKMASGKTGHLLRRQLSLWCDMFCSGCTQTGGSLPHVISMESLEKGFSHNIRLWLLVY